MNVIFNIHITCSSNQLEIVFLSEGEARAAVVQALPENPHGTGFSASSTTKASGAVPRAAPFRTAQRRAAREGGIVEGATPLFTPPGAARRGESNFILNFTLTLPFSGGRSLHSDPCGKVVESARKPTAKSSAPQMALRPRGARREDAHNPISPIRSTGSLPLHLTAWDSGLILG